MDESNRWGSLQYLTLLLVMMAHAALLAWLMMAWRAREDAATASDSVQLVLLQPRSLPRIRIDSVRRRRIEIRVLPTDPPPLLEGVSSSTPAPASHSGSKDGGSGVDWAAEARRALQAFEIRTRQPARNNSVSRSSPAEQPWWPAHRPGERVKTADGNWIVWINSSCYQVATSLPSTSGSGPQPPTICPKRTNAADAPDGAPPDPAE
jgi:hypothetical protein